MRQRIHGRSCFTFFSRGRNAGLVTPWWEGDTLPPLKSGPLEPVSQSTYSTGGLRLQRPDIEVDWMDNVRKLKAFLLSGAFMIGGMCGVFSTVQIGWKGATIAIVGGALWILLRELAG